MADGESNGHVIDDVTRPCNVKVVTPRWVSPIVLKMAGAGQTRYNGTPIGNGPCGIKRSRSR